ncbi:MAG: hypothetical protein P4M11_08155 [Candidatus Pacebacteria bacterium]|nr:hypothetical protein [Candidatus Paceibacterota bacterium]
MRKANGEPLKCASKEGTCSGYVTPAICVHADIKLSLNIYSRCALSLEGCIGLCEYVNDGCGCMYCRVCLLRYRACWQRRRKYLDAKNNGRLDTETCKCGSDKQLFNKDVERLFRNFDEDDINGPKEADEFVAKQDKPSS